MRRLAIAVGLALVVGATLTAAGATASGIATQTPTPKVDVCHVDRDGVVRLKSVGADSLATHLAHGDALPGVIDLPAGTTFNASNSRTDGPFGPASAFDGGFDGVSTYAWNSGEYPVQWIEVNFGSPQAFSKIRGWVAQTPAGYTNHDVTLDGAPAFSWSGYTTEFDWLTHTFDTMQYAQTVRVTTTVDPSWVAWLEIQLIGC
jgi:hypothetical protein